MALEHAASATVSNLRGTQQPARTRDAGMLTQITGDSIQLHNSNQRPVLLLHQYMKLQPHTVLIGGLV